MICLAHRETDRSNYTDAANVFGHGLVGGTSSWLSGGDFRSGFIGASFGALASPVVKLIPGDGGGYVMARVLVAGMIGGTSSHLAGGDFGSGFATAAFGRLFNDEGLAHQTSPVSSSRLSYLDNAGGFLDTTGFAAGAGQYTYLTGNSWLGANGNYYSLGWGGNGATGARAFAIKTAGYFEYAGKISLVLSVSVDTIQGLGAYSQGDMYGAWRAVINGGIGVATTYGGPIGWGIGGGYLILEQSGGREWMSNRVTDGLCRASGNC